MLSILYNSGFYTAGTKRGFYVVKIDKTAYHGYTKIFRKLIFYILMQNDKFQIYRNFFEKTVSTFERNSPFYKFLLHKSRSRSLLSWPHQNTWWLQVSCRDATLCVVTLWVVERHWSENERCINLWTNTPHFKYQVHNILWP